MPFQSHTSDAVCLQPLVALLEDVLAVGCLLLHGRVVIGSSAKWGQCGHQVRVGPSITASPTPVQLQEGGAALEELMGPGPSRQP